MKKLLALILAAALALSLAACGDSGETQTETPSTSIPESIVPTENTETEQPSDNVPPAETPSEDVEPSPTPEEEFVAVTIGETITLEGVDVELTTAEFQSNPDKLGGYMSFSTHNDSNEYFWLSGKMTNVGTETISSRNDVMVNIIFDDTYTYEGNLEVRDDMGPFAESEVWFWADVPPAMLERYETVKVRFAYNDGFADYDWEAADYERTFAGFDHQYEFVLGEGAAAAGDAGDAGSSASTIGLWSVNYYVDDFQQPTEDWYITTNTQFSGTFSNSATTNSNLLAQVAYDYKDNLTIFLWEYGRNQVKNASSNYVDEYDITMRDQNGNDQKLSGTVYCGGDRLVIEGADKDKIIAAMKEPGTVSFYIVESDRTTTSYLFSLETSNFSQVYEEMSGK